MNDLRAIDDDFSGGNGKILVYRLHHVEADDGYEADDDDENDSSSYESCSSKDHDKPCGVPIFFITIGKRSKRKSRSSPTLSLPPANPQFNDKNSTQLIEVVVRSYCQRYEDRLQLQKNFISARFGKDDFPSDSTSFYLTDTNDSSEIDNDASSWTTATSTKGINDANITGVKNSL
jgi:hypothetical protein